MKSSVRQKSKIMADRHKILECSICRKTMRSNNLKRHWRTKHKMFDMGLTVTVEAKSKVGESSSTGNNLESEILDNAKIYDEKISLGERIHKVLMETNAKEESLSRQHKEAFDLYQRQRLAINPDKVVKLYPWQQQALEFIRKPSHREIIWIKGPRGNEGKTWFQNYVQSLIGYDRVIQFDLKNSIGTIMQVLRKLPLSTLDTFLFNDARSGQRDLRCYDALELIKDGHATASRYSSEILRFRTPNVVAVFSNADPDMSQLSKDRWKVFYINKDGLSSQEKRLWKKRHSRESNC